MDVWLPMVIYGSFSCVAAILAFWLPETKDEKLADTAAETLGTDVEKKESEATLKL